MPIVRDLNTRCTSPWSIRGFEITHPEKGGKYFLFISCREADGGLLAAHGYVNKPGTDLTTSAATEECLGLSGWDEPALTLLDVVRYWGGHSYSAAGNPLPDVLDRAIRGLCSGSLDPSGFQACVEGV